MEQEIKQAISMGVQLVISATVIATIASALYIGKALMKVRANEEFSGNLIATQSMFSNYMNKQGEIVGSDVVDIMLTYSKIYNFAVVDKSSGSATLVMYRLTGDDIETFRTEDLVGDMQGKLFDKFKMQQILTSDGNAVVGIVFTSGGTSACTPAELEKIKTQTFNITSDFSHR